MRQSLLILSTLILGFFFPAVAGLAFLIQPLLMVQLFLSFLRLRPADLQPRRQHALVFAAQVVVGVASFLLVRLLDSRVAEAVFVTALAPTAAAAVVVIELLRRDVGFVVTAVLINTFGLALALPLLLPALGIRPAGLSVLELMGNVLFTLGVPLLASALLGRVWPRGREWLLGLRGLGMAVFLSLIFLGSARTAEFFLEQPASAYLLLVWIGLATAVLCVFNFWLGFRLGGTRWGWESSIALGRKNAMLAVWLALAALHPAAIVGPMLYIVWQNVLNGAQMAWRDRGERVKE